MYSAQKLLEMITSEKTSTRYDACEWLRVRPDSSPEIIYALQKASSDPDPDVAQRAAYALEADAHHRQAVKMGLAAADAREVEDQRQASIPPEEKLLQASRGDYAGMLSDIRSWGIWSLIFGVLSLVTSGIFSSPWGILLILIGLASFYFRTASMFVVYGVILAWAAIHNFTGLDLTWAIFALIQVYATVSVFLKYRRYHKAEQAILGRSIDQSPESLATNRAARLFPWFSVFLGSLSIIGVVFGILLELVIYIEAKSTTAIPGYVAAIEQLSFNLGILGFAIGLASLLSHYRLKALAIVGLVAGVLTMLIELFFLVIRLIG